MLEISPVTARSRFPDWFIAVLLALVTILAYQPAWHAGFIWDDDAHITAPELRSLHGLARIWMQPGATQQYYPLSESVFWVEHKLWGEATTGYHWLNILLHAISALLLVKVLRQLKIPGAWLAAALFALHPVEVESVAWIAELKNTLSGVFYLSAVVAYLGFDQNRNKGNYAMALGLFLLGLLSKTAIAPLPAALLVIFWWQRGRLSWKRDVWPLLPFFIAGIGAGLLTTWVEQNFVGAKGVEYNFSIIERFLIAGRGVWFYLGKLFWPVDLAFNYPHWNVSQGVWWQYLFPAAVLVLLGVLVWRRWRGPLAGLLFFVGMLFPALGFFNGYSFRYSFVSDHFQYLASLGPLTLAAAGITAGLGFLWKRTPWLESLFYIGLLLVLGTLTWKQCGMYANIETLWQTTLRLNPHSWIAHNNLGVALYAKGKTDEGIRHYQEAIRLNPDYDAAHNNLGAALGGKGQIDEAIRQYEEVIRLKPNFPEAHYNLGIALDVQGQIEKAINQYQEAIRLNPDYAEAHNNLGMALGRKGQMDEAISQFQEALRLKPDLAEAHNNLGIVLGRKGQMDEAIKQFQETIRLKPAAAEAHNHLGVLLGKKGQIDEAIGQYREAIRLNPDYAEAHNNLGMLLGWKGQINEAITQFQEAIRLKPGDAEARSNLARALSMKNAPASR